MKQGKKSKTRKIWYVIGGIAFAVGMYVVMSELTEKGADYLYSKNKTPIKPLDDNDWGPEIVKKSTLEGADDEI